jgi:signal transducing adaptor molecule
LGLICKKLISKNPNENMMALELLNCCVSNCGVQFHQIVCSREMEKTIQHMVKNSNKKIVAKLMKFLKKWSEDDFKGKSNLKLLPSLYKKLVDEGVEIESQSETRNHYLEESARQKEEQNLKEAIQLSLKETSRSSSGATSGALYPSFDKSVKSNDFQSNTPNPPAASATVSKQPYKVRAKYDFEAGDKDEITLESGEILLVIDDRYLKAKID